MNEIKLRVTPAQGEPFDFVVDKETVVIGRSSSADLALTDPFLSRYHAKLTLRGDDLMIEDLGSRNGTFVNDEELRDSVVVSPGDVIKLSASLIELPGSSRTTVMSVTKHDEDSGSGATIFRPASELLSGELKSSPALYDSADELRRYAERLEILKDVHEALTTSASQKELLDLILDRVFDHLKPQQGVIFLRETDGEFYQAATRSVEGYGSDITLSRSLVSEVLDKGNAALVFDVETDERFAASESILMSGVRSMLAAPLLDADGPMGMIVLNSKIAVRQFSEEDMELLTSLSSVAALKIRNQALLEEAAERRRLQDEMSLARRIQKTLLPRELPRLEGFTILARNEPSRGVSGDYYQALLRSDGRECVLLLADVAGKGVAASLVTASLEALAVAFIEGGYPPDEISNRLSPLLFQRTPPEKYATALVGVLDTETNLFTFCNAGHNPALLIRRGGDVELMQPTGMPLGLMPHATYTAGSLTIEPGDTIFIYTDGITEAENTEEEEFGLQRLIKITSSLREREPEAFIEELQLRLDEFVGPVPFADDRTFILLRREA